MSMLTVRNVPEEVVEALKALARSNGLSMEQQVRDILREQALDRMDVINHVHIVWDEFLAEITPAEVDRWIGVGRPEMST